MKAKAPQGQKVIEAGDYICQRCDTRFHVESDTSVIVCPACGDRDKTDLVAFYVEDDPQEDILYTDGDFGQGD